MFGCNLFGNYEGGSIGGNCVSNFWISFRRGNGWSYVSRLIFLFVCVWWCLFFVLFYFDFIYW